MFKKMFGREGPALVPTDTVAPIRFWDDTMVLKSLVVHSLARYDTALDPKKLHDSLERLASLKGWRKLGARLRKNDKGEIEYHVPAEFTAERPAVSFSHVDYVMPISEHPLASKLPQPSSTRPAVVGDPGEFTSLVQSEQTPTSIDDYLTQDRGQLGLHVVSFTDATLVVLYYNHTSFDLLGWGALMTAWTHVLHGRESLVATPVGGDPGSDDFDSLRNLGTNPTERHVLADRHMPLSSLVGYGFRNVVDMAVRAKENRIVCVPGAFVQKLRAEALAELEAAAGPGEKPFVSEADVLAAWWARIAVTSLMAPESKRTVSIQYAASARKALGLSSDPAKDPYFSNMFTILYSLLPAHDIINKPVSYLASEIRRSIVEQGTREQVEAYFALQRQSPGRMFPSFGDAGMHMMTLSNWGKADLYGHDFGPAALSKEEGAKGQFPSYIQTTQLPFSFPEGFCTIGKDGKGNWWLYGFRVAGLWAKIEKVLAEIEV
ncbi:hypothetical protein F4809DRAFT_601081 [Biscogniauxia mediterranea]|nr:hypothetical protein F4809DRAFT_601081 [Biscogniauxia mediterranea]